MSPKNRAASEYVEQQKRSLPAYGGGWRRTLFARDLRAGFEPRIAKRNVNVNQSST